MKISLENVGKVKRANIEIGGITVITGENNTGKSTVGKALFSIFNSFYESKKTPYLEIKDLYNGEIGKIRLTTDNKELQLVIDNNEVKKVETENDRLVNHSPLKAFSF